MCRLRQIFAGVAQAVEQRIRNAWVGGSNPSTGTRFSASNRRGPPWADNVLTLFVIFVLCRSVLRRAILFEKVIVIRQLGKIVTYKSTQLFKLSP